MSNIIKEHYEKYDELYEKLEVSPYNAAYNYYSSGWTDGIRVFESKIVNLIKQHNINCDISDILAKALKESL